MLKSISLRLCTLIVLLFAGIYSFAQQVQVKGTVMEEAEWVIMPRAIDLIANGKVTVEDGHVKIKE